MKKDEKYFEKHFRKALRRTFEGNWQAKYPGKTKEQVEQLIANKYIKKINNYRSRVGIKERVDLYELV
jgi:hypothetical protein